MNRKFNMYLDNEDGGEDSDYDYSDFGVDAGRQNKTGKPENNKKNPICNLFSLYGNMDQHKRAEILSKFCKASQGVLVCTVSLTPDPNNFMFVFDDERCGLYH